MVPVWVVAGNWNASLVAVSPETGRPVALAHRPGSVCWISQRSGTAWVVTDLGINSTANMVSRIDARSGRELAHGTAGGQVAGIATVGDRLWLTVGSDVVGLDGASLQRMTAVQGPEPLVGLAGGAGKLWTVAADSRTLLGIDPGTARVVVQRPLGFAPALVGGVVFAGRHLWVADASGNRVVQLDPMTTQVVSTVAVGGSSFVDPSFGWNVSGMVLVGDRLWVYHLVSEGKWELIPVDLTTGKVAGRGVAMPAIGVCGMATDGHDVWFGRTPEDPSQVGLFKADLRTRTVSRVAGLTHNETFDLTLSR